MATQKSQRIGILIILVVLVIGTIGSFAAMVLGSQIQSQDNAKRQKLLSDYQAKTEEYKKAITKQGDELSVMYYPQFSPYASRVAAFDAAGVTELGKEDLVVGEGEEITDVTEFAAYYIGWNPKGTIFDQSIDGDKLKAPFAISDGLKNGGVIKGWKDGLVGMRIGGVRELTIPSDLAYGEQGSGDNIPPNTPLKFVVMAIVPPEEIAAPEYPPELMQMMGGA